MNMFNPLDKLNLGISIRNALLEQPLIPMHSISAFSGAGIYAIYYAGINTPYSPYDWLAASFSTYQIPIYVGKADPSGARVGRLGLDSTNRSLYDRLRQHSSSVFQTINLDISDFFFRYLIVDDIWIPLGEAMMIDKFKPLWNTTVKGFGNKDQGGNRNNQQRSRWDTLHAGRIFADNFTKPNPLSVEQILAEVESAIAVLRSSQISND